MDDLEDITRYRVRKNNIYLASDAERSSSPANYYDERSFVDFEKYKELYISYCNLQDEVQYGE